MIISNLNLYVFKNRRHYWDTSWTNEWISTEIKGNAFSEKENSLSNIKTDIIKWSYLCR